MSFKFESNTVNIYKFIKYGLEFELRTALLTMLP